MIGRRRPRVRDCTPKRNEPDQHIRRGEVHFRKAHNENVLMNTSPDPRRTLRLFAAYYVVTGLWPLFSLRTFVAITGRKTDTWLVQTFGALIAAVGAALGLIATRDPRAAAAVAAAGAVSLSSCELVFVARRRISPIYLGDAVLELWALKSMLPLLQEKQTDAPNSGRLIGYTG